MTETVTLPRRALVVLCGPAGAGKSTFAGDIVRSNGLAPTTAVSSDACRVLLCDDPRTVAPELWPVLQPKTFDLFLAIVGMRLSLGRPTIADGVNLHMELRPRLLELARTHGATSVLVAFDVSLETCLSQNAQRARRMPEEQIRAQRQALEACLPGLVGEGWDHVLRLSEERRAASIVWGGPGQVGGHRPSEVGTGPSPPTGTPHPDP
jgi:predicted kinase